MTITVELLKADVASYASIRDQLLAEADRLAKKRTELLDNANTNHGAMLASQALLDRLMTQPTAETPLPPVAGPKYSDVPPVFSDNVPNPLTDTTMAKKAPTIVLKKDRQKKAVDKKAAA